MTKPLAPRPTSTSSPATAGAPTSGVAGRLAGLAALPAAALRDAVRGSRRAPAFAAGILVSIALGAGLGAAVLGLFRVESGAPPRIASALRVDAVPGVDWDGGWSPAVEPPAVSQAASLLTLERILATLAILALAVGALNIILLLIGRIAARRHEIAVRVALGATRGGILAQLLAEAALLGIAGAGLARAVASIATRLLRDHWPAGLLPWTDGGAGAAVTLALPVLVVAFALLAPTAALSRAPALRAPLGAGARVTPGRREMRLRGTLAAVQIAVALTLLSAAGMLVRNSLPLQEPATLGYDPRDTLAVPIDLAGASFDREAERAAAIEALVDRAAALPGARGASIASPGAWLGLGTADRVLAHCGGCYIGGLYFPAVTVVVRHHAVSPGFFQTHGAPVVAGREFNRGDRQGAERVALVNETFARDHFHDGDPLGRLVQVGGLTGEWHTIVGVVPDMRARGPGNGSEPAPALYVSALQHPPRSVELAIRADGDPLALAAAVPATLDGIGSGAGAGEPTTLEARIARFAAPIRWFGGLYAGLAGAALLLAVVGIHAAMSDQVLRRRREIGTRLALGATPRRIVGLVAGRSIRLTAAGAALGLLGALTAARLLQLLFAGIRLFDPKLFGAIALALGAAALIGAAIPAHRAARVDPAIPLHAE